LPMPVYASIDAGANAVRMLIADFDPEKGRAGFKRLRYERRTTRLGSFEGGSLSENRMRATLETLKEYCQIISDYAPDRVRAVGTSAFREAPNSKDLLREVFYETGIRIEVISPEREARLTALGVAYFLPDLPAHALILDVGGGSTEWVLLKEKTLIKWGSIPVGVVKLWDRIKGLSDWEGVLEKELSAFSFTLKENFPSLPEDSLTLIETGGTASTIAMMDLELPRYEHERIHGHRVGIERLKELYRKIKKTPLAERALLKGLPPDRADLIMPGIGLTIITMEMFGMNGIVISDTGLPEGIIIEALRH